SWIGGANFFRDPLDQIDDRKLHAFRPLAQFGAGEEKQILYQPDKPFRFPVEVLDQIGLGIKRDVTAWVVEQSGCAEDRRNGRPKLMGDDAEKLVLGLVRALQLFAG